MQTRPRVTIAASTPRLARRRVAIASATRGRGRAPHSAPELGLLAICAGAVLLIAGLVTFSILRDAPHLRDAPASIYP